MVVPIVVQERLAELKKRRVRHAVIFKDDESVDVAERLGDPAGDAFGTAHVSRCVDSRDVAAWVDRLANASTLMNLRFFFGTIRTRRIADDEESLGLRSSDGTHHLRRFNGAIEGNDRHVEAAIVHAESVPVVTDNSNRLIPNTISRLQPLIHVNSIT